MKPFFHSGLCTCVHAVTTLKSFFRILKHRTSPSYRTGTCNYSGFLSNSSFVTVHSSYSFTLSVFLLSPCSGTARKCLRRPVFSFGRNLTFSDVTTVRSHRAVQPSKGMKYAWQPGKHIHWRHHLFCFWFRCFSGRRLPYCLCPAKTS